MPCGCKKAGPQFGVQIAGGKVVFVTGNRSTADSVARRYPNSVVIEMPKN